MNHNRPKSRAWLKWHCRCNTSQSLLNPEWSQFKYNPDCNLGMIYIEAAIPDQDKKLSPLTDISANTSEGVKAMG